MRRHTLTLLLATAALAALRASARADGTIDADNAPQADAAAVARSGLFLRGMQAAGPNRASAAALSFGGYDSARRTPVFEAAAEVALARRLSVRAGASYLPGEHDDRGSVRPNVVVRANLLEQARSGVDLSVLAAYRQERYTQDGGLIEAGAAAGHRWDRLALIGNLTFASDPEGDDHEGSLGGAALYRLTGAVNVGAQGFFRRDLGSTDLRRAMRNDTKYDFTLCPVASYTRDRFILTMQAGLAGLQGATSSALGVLALGGVGAVF